MNLSDPHTFELFLQVYDPLPRAGPGGDEHTRRALGSVPETTPRAVLDAGCGPGAYACLARALPQAHIVAGDLLAEMVEETNRRLTEAGVANRARPGGDMAQPTDAPPEEIRTWWVSEHPAMSDDGEIRAQVDRAGYVRA